MVKGIKSQKRTLFLITSSFPYGEFESFLEVEFPYLADAFDSVFIIHTELRNGVSRIINTSVKVHYLPYLPNKKDKWKYPRFLLNPFAVKEIITLLFKDSRIPFSGILSSIAGSLTVGYKLKKMIVDLINSNKLWGTEIYLYSYWCNDMATGLALLKSSFPNLNCISRAHGYDVYLERNLLNYLPFRRFIFSTLDTIHFVSEHGKNYAETTFGYFKSFKVSYLGVDEGKSEDYNLSSKKLHLVSCSSVNKVKRIHIIIEAMVLLESLEIHWTHIGGGELLAAMEEYANKMLAVKPNVTYKFLGQLSNKETLHMYSEYDFDLFLNVSESEGIPVSMMEAISNGVPVLGPDIGGISELIVDGSNGIILPPEVSAKELAKRIKYFSELEGPEAGNMSKQAKSIWKKHFRAETNFGEFIKQSFYNTTIT